MKGCDDMRTLYLRNEKGNMIGKVEVDLTNNSVKVTEIRKVTKLKPLAWFLLGAASVLAIVGLAFGMAKMSERSERWYQECDAHYGYTTDYYTCRLYHIRGGE